MSRCRLAAATASTVIALACSTAAAPMGGTAEQRPIVTDSLVYRLRRVGWGYDAYAVATYVNRTGVPVRYPSCGSYSLGRSGADSGRPAFIGVAWGCPGGIPAGVVEPGDTLRFRVWLGSTESAGANPPIRPEERVGRFRIVFELCAAPAAGSDACDALPRQQRESNAFEVAF